MGALIGILLIIWGLEKDSCLPIAIGLLFLCGGIRIE